MNKPLVSIIMGVYNCEQTLDEAVQSIIEQTYTNWEFIICDDGSRDLSWDKLQAWAGKDSRIILIQNECNMGLPFTLNHALSHTKGSYIARMDADDLAVLDRFEKQVVFLESHQEYALVGSWIELFDEDRGTWGVRKSKEAPEKEDLLFGSPFVHPAVMMRAEVLNNLGGYRVSKETMRGQDYDLWLRMYAAGYQGYNLQEVLLRFRENNKAYKRRNYRKRLDETKIRYRGFKALHLFPKAAPYVIKPLIVGLFSQAFLQKLRDIRNK